MKAVKHFYYILGRKYGVNLDSMMLSVSRITGILRYIWLLIRVPK
jgi:hypothetical protein